MASKWCLALMSLESVRAVALRLVEVCGARWCNVVLLGQGLVRPGGPGGAEWG